MTRPAVGRSRPDDHLDGGGFARAVGAEEAVDLAAPDAQVEAVDGDLLAEVTRDIVEDQCVLAIQRHR
ncbi:MAG: hypothetical protein R2856_39620 [Caldilineaceae bacterium]